MAGKICVQALTRKTQSVEIVDVKRCECQDTQVEEDSTEVAGERRWECMLFAIADISGAELRLRACLIPPQRMAAGCSD